ncbi:WD40-repeat-containing domain protein [Gorgonomyces haynaldii]|nr:WD40-repeat-containing domain protein [Gorgonomyces haynaldii]
MLVFGDTQNQVLEQDQEVEFFVDTLGQEEEAQEQQVWEDEDDIEVNIQDKKRLRKLKTDFEEHTVSGKEYEQRLRKQYEKMHPTPNWAQASAPVETVFSTTKKLIKRKTTVNPDKLDIVRLKDANQAQYSQAVVQQVDFHPNAAVLLTGGFDRTVRIFQIDGKVNPKLQSLKIKDMPVASAHFTNDGNEIIITGKRPYFYVYNLQTTTVQKILGIRGRPEKTYEHSLVSPCNNYLAILGSNGYIILVSLLTKQWVGNLKMNAEALCMQFSSDKKTLYSMDADCYVYRFDLESRECTGKFIDHGCIKPSAIAISPDEQWIATGQDSGVVNIYSMSKAFATVSPHPEKMIMNLTTTITTLVFHPSSQLLCLASKMTKDALRLFHPGSMRVVKNWPTDATPLGYVSDVKFSNNGKYIAIGNAKGKVLLYQFGMF